MDHLRSNAIAYLALFLSLGSGTAVAVSGSLKADTVDGLSAARFRQVDSTPVATVRVLELAGMRVRYSCQPNSAKRGSSADVELDMRTGVDNATVSSEFTTGSDPSGASFTLRDFDLDVGNDYDLDQGRSFGEGSVTYSQPGSVVTLKYGFNEGVSECLAHGVALGG